MAIDFGPLKTLLETEDVTEIMVNSHNKVYVEHNGFLVETSVRFVDVRQFEELIYSILSENKKTLGSSLFFDGMLPNGYRYNITLPPLSNKGPSLTIRKFNKKVFTLEDLVKTDFISEKAAQFIKAAVSARLNIVISGGTGSGKTSFLGCLASQISFEERIVTIEDVPELRIEHPNWVSLQAVQNEKYQFNTKQCLTNALRMRPDRIIVGECRKDETFEMLQAMNSGHEGSMTSIHSNSAVDCLSRIESLIQFGGTVDLPLKQVRYQMSKAIDLIIQIRRNRADGKREVVEIAEITGMDHDIITRSIIFERDKSGKLSQTGYVPQALSKINLSQSLLPSNFFATAASPLRKAS